MTAVARPIAAIEEGDRIAGPGDLAAQANRFGKGPNRQAVEDPDLHEKLVQTQQRQQLQRLKDESRAIFGMVDGRPGVRSLKDLRSLLEKAGDEIGNGRFIVRYLGAERYLDAATVAVLITLRQNLIADAGRRASTADIMVIDAAVVSYYNFLRVQGWIGNLSLIFERELFGEAALNEIHGPTLGSALKEQLERLSEVILPLQDRAHRMMIRSLEQLHRPSQCRKRSGRNRSRS